MQSMVILSLLLAAQLELVAPHGEKAAVLFFIRADCPISNRYVPEIERIYKAYGHRGFDIHLVYSEPDLSIEAMQAHRREYQLSAPAITDPEHRYVKLAHIHTTPSAAVFVNGRLVYDGRIDNRFVSFSKTRTSGIQHDLTGVLDAIEAGKTPPLRETSAVGCAVEDVQ
jgi:hypothetical protein